MQSNSENDDNRRKGILASVLFHAVLILLMILPLLTYQNPPPGQQGITVNLGDNSGQGFENVEIKEPEPEPEPEPEAEPEPVEEEVEEIVEEPVEEPVEEIVEEVTEPTEVVETIDEEALELERKRKEKEKQDAIKAQQEKERKEREAEEARKRKEAADRFKNIGKGTGKGNTNTAGNQGDDLGDPDSKNLEGAAKGNGQVGGGLGDRGIGSRPDIANNTSNTGTVVINLCVDSNGNVIPSSVRFTSAGSTTQNSTLKNIAISNAKRWKFSPSSKAEECGSITYKFEN